MRLLRRHFTRAFMTTVLLALVSAPALARTENVRWAHPDPGSVAGFKVHIGNSAGSYTQSIDVGFPMNGNEFLHALTVADGSDVFLAVTAYDANGLESPYSNEGFRPAPLSAPGVPVVVGN